MKRIYLLGLLALLSALPIHAQPQLTWWRLYDYDATYDLMLDIYRLAGGGYAITGVYDRVANDRHVYITWIVKLADDFELLWKRTYEIYSSYTYISSCIIEADNGDLLVPGGIPVGLHGSQFGAVRIDTEGNEIWRRSIGGNNGGGYAIIELKSGNFIISGEVHVRDEASTKLLPHLAMINGDGDLIWERTYDLCKYGEFSTLHEFDGGVVAAGRISDYFDPMQPQSLIEHLLAVKVDEDGNDMWQRQYDIGHDFLRVPSSVTTPDGGLAITGTAATNGVQYGPYILKIDPEDGTQMWFQQYEDYSIDDSSFDSYCISRYNDDGFLLVGSFMITPPREGFILFPYALATDSDGNILWHSAYRLGDLDPRETQARFHGVTIGPDGSAIVCGTAYNTANPDSPTWDGLVAKLEPSQQNPVLFYYSPEDTILYRLPGDALTFLVRARDQQGDAMSYLWTFDGDSAGTDSTYFATFPDEYRDVPVSCTISDDKGNSTTVTWHVNIVPFYITAIQPDSTALLIKRRTSVEFGITLRSVPGDQFEYLWRVGRDSSGLDSVMTHEFDYTGKSRVTVNVSRNDGWADTSWSVKVVGLIGDWWPELTDTTVTQGDSLYFDVLPYKRGEDTLRYLWTLNADSISSDSEVCATFPNFGEQRVTGYILTAADSDSVSWHINVIPKEGISPFPLSHFLTFSLDAPYPNPFNQSSVVSYQLSVAGKVNLELYDIQGRLVETLVDGWQKAGTHQAIISNQQSVISNQILPTGIYIIRLHAGKNVMTKKAVLIR